MFSQIHGHDWKDRKNHNGGTVTFFSTGMPKELWQQKNDEYPHGQTIRNNDIIIYGVGFVPASFEMTAPQCLPWPGEGKTYLGVFGPNFIYFRLVDFVIETYHSKHVKFRDRACRIRCWTPSFWNRNRRQMRLLCVGHDGFVRSVPRQKCTNLKI